MDNSKKRLHDVFFYGLYMDETILKSKDVKPRKKRVGVAKGYALRVGKMATLLRDKKSKAYGIVYALTHKEIHALYAGSGLDHYVAEAIEVTLEDKTKIPVLCCNLLNPPEDKEFNEEYLTKLLTCMKTYKLPLPKKV